MSPLRMSIAIWYHCRIGDYGNGTGDGNFNSTAVQSALQDLVNAGLLERGAEANTQKYFSTDGLAVYVNALSRIPFPVRQWVIPTTSGTAQDAGQ